MWISMAAPHVSVSCFNTRRTGLLIFIPDFVFLFFSFCRLLWSSFFMEGHGCFFFFFVAWFWVGFFFFVGFFDGICPFFLCFCVRLWSFSLLATLPLSLGSFDFFFHFFCCVLFLGRFYCTNSCVYVLFGMCLLVLFIYQACGQHFRFF